jgi:hypothetical protein
MKMDFLGMFRYFACHLSKKMYVILQLRRKARNRIRTLVCCILLCFFTTPSLPFTDEVQTALFKTPVRTAL